MKNNFEPCQFMEHDTGTKSIFLSDFDAVSDQIEDAGGQGGGHSWESLVKAVIELRSLNFPDVEFDSEGDMFCALSVNTEQLAEIASITRELFADPELLQRAIDTAIDGDYFE